MTDGGKEMVGGHDSNSEPKKKPGKRWLFWVKLLSAVLLLLFLLHQNRLDLAVMGELVLEPWLVFGVVGMTMTVFLLAGFRWHLLLVSQEIPLSRMKAIQVTFIGMFFGLFLPGGLLGGDALRVAYAIQATKHNRGGAALSVLVDRAIGFYALLLLGLVAAFLNPEAIMGNPPLRILAMINLLLLVVGPVVGLLTLWLVWKSDRLRSFVWANPDGLLQRILSRAADAVKLYRRAIPLLFGALGLSVLSQALGIASVVLIGLSTEGGVLAFLDYAFVTAWTLIANTIPLTPGGIGVGEAAFDQLCRWIEPMPSMIAYGSLFFVYRILTLGAALPGFFAYLIYRNEVDAHLETGKMSEGGRGAS
ncbi:MAG: flippase-like domain-containing protein [Magnetococcales bacterium]|nr:flippase-like domain-containing protein [Magnetococcales bacterium]